MTAVTWVLAEIAAGRLVVSAETVRGLEVALDAVLELGTEEQEETA